MPKEPNEAVALAHAVMEEMTIIVNAAAELEQLLPNQGRNSQNMRLLRAAAVRLIMRVRPMVRP